MVRQDVDKVDIENKKGKRNVHFGLGTVTIQTLLDIPNLEERNLFGNAVDLGNSKKDVLFRFYQTDVSINFPDN